MRMVQVIRRLFHWHHYHFINEKFFEREYGCPERFFVYRCCKCGKEIKCRIEYHDDDGIRHRYYSI